MNRKKLQCSLPIITLFTPQICSQDSLVVLVDLIIQSFGKTNKNYGLNGKWLWASLFFNFRQLLIPETHHWSSSCARNTSEGNYKKKKKKHTIQTWAKGTLSLWAMVHIQIQWKYSFANTCCLLTSLDLKLISKWKNTGV